MNKISLILLLLLPVWNCSEDDEAVIDNAANDENAQRTFAEAQAWYEALGENFKQSLTREAGFPTSGAVVYKGIHMGEFFERKTTAGFKLDYFANVVFTLDFEAQTFTGKLINFTTNLEGFENPEGSPNVSGSRMN